MDKLKYKDGGWHIHYEARRLSKRLRIFKWNFHFIKHAYKNREHPWMGNWEFYRYTE